MSPESLAVVQFMDWSILNIQVGVSGGNSTPKCAGAGVWDRLVEYIDDELGNIQALRVVSRAFVSEDSTATLCHLAFHEINILLDPFSNPRAPIWTRCIALYSRVD